MAYNTILAKIKSEIEEITDIGIVHDYRRYSRDWTKFLALFRPEGKEYIRGWDISRVASPEEIENINASNLRTYDFMIRGFAQLDDEDASEKTFQGLIESICDKFRFNVQLDNTVIISTPIQVTTVDIRPFGAVLCHYAELTYSVRERKQP